MTQALLGKTPEEARALFHDFRKMVTEGGEPSDTLGKLAVFKGVCEFPVRVKCATLAWHTLFAAMDEATHTNEPVTTE